MRTIIILLILLSIHINSVFSQHCPFDNMGILVVNVTDACTGIQLNDVVISLQDSSGQVLVNFDKEKMYFVKNPDKTGDWYPYNHKKLRYSFAKDYFILPVVFEKKTYNSFIVVERKTKKYDYIVKYKITKNDIFDLHDNVGDWTELSKQKETPKPAQEFKHLITIELNK